MPARRSPSRPTAARPLAAALGLVVLATAGAAWARAAAPACPPGSPQVAGRCLGFPKAVRIRLAADQAGPSGYARIAARERVPVSAVRRVARDPATLILAPDRAGADGLEATASCEGDRPRAVARLAWQPGEPRGTAQRVVVALLPESLGTGRFTSSGALPADRAALAWTRISGQANHLWWVLTLRANGWAPSEPGSFTGPGCVADYQPTAHSSRG